MAHDVFISFSFKDQEIAEKIVNQLTNKYGISCWISANDIQLASNYYSQIANAIHDAKVVVFLQSKSSMESSSVQDEILTALDERKTVMMLKIDQTELTGALRLKLFGAAYIDATIPTLDERIYDLAEMISKAIGKPLSKAFLNEEDKTLRSSRIDCSEIFVGRDELIKDIHTAFADCNLVFLYGEAGIGKTELAKHYWYKHRDFYNPVVFAKCDKDLVSIIADDTIFDVTEFGRKVTTFDELQNDASYAEDKLLVIKHITDEHTLIIFDEFDISTEDNLFFEKIISCLKCRILITTRHKPSLNKYYSIHVGEMDDESLKELFIRYGDLQEIVEPNDPELVELLSLTNRSTYMLELAAKCMSKNWRINSLSDLVEYLKEYGIRFLFEPTDILRNAVDNNDDFIDSQKLSVFLSHSHKDIEKVRKLRDILEYLECEPLLFYLKCLDDDDDELQSFIKREIEARNIFLYCKSQNAENSSWVQKELDYIKSFDSNRLYTIDIDKNLTRGMIGLLQTIIDIVQGNQVFISYSHKDQHLFEKIKKYLSSQGYNVFNAVGEFKDESSQRSKLDEVSNNGIFIPLVTANYMQSIWCNRELEYAIYSKATVVPVVTNNVELSKKVKSLSENTSWIQVSEDLTDDDLKNVLQTIKYANFIRT